MHGEDFVHELYDASYRRLVGQLTAVTGNREEAEDVVQEAFARALLHSRTLIATDNPEAWVRTVAVNAARSRLADVVLADTAGRLPTQANLMDELRKIRRVLGKAREGAPDEVWLVVDANTGQNALAQVRAFDAAVGLTGLILTKLDGSAKGGIVAAIARQHPIPLKFIGVGEAVDDLRPFHAEEFVDALLPDEPAEAVGPAA